MHYWADNYRGEPINEFLSERVIAWRKKTRAIPPGKEQGMTYYKPLTPEFRARINESVRSIEIELNTCQNTPYVTAQKIGLQALENLINALPDGFPLPMKRRDNHDGEGSNKNI